MKIGIFQDVHANMPAFTTAMQYFIEQECAKIYHVGDLIDIGPHPAEVFHAARKVDNLHFIMGNHDYWYGYGIPDTKREWTSEEEEAHQRWTHAQIGPGFEHLVRSWPFMLDLQIEGHHIRLQHYSLTADQSWFKNYIPQPSISDLDNLFGGVSADIMFFGHDHESLDKTGNCRYINLGSTGCFTKAVVRLGILTCEDGDLSLKKVSLPYDDNGLMDDYDIRAVPARDFIRRRFILR